MTSDNGEWLEYRRLVLNEIRRLDGRAEAAAKGANQVAIQLNSIEGKLGDMRADIAEMKLARQRVSTNVWQFWTAVTVAVLSLTGVVMLAAVQALR